jgi:hypothetical protein
MRMLKGVAVFAIAIVALLGSVTTAPAIAIYTSAAGDGFGTLTCVDGAVSCGVGGIANITSLPTPWQANNPGGSNAVWVSFDANHGTSGLGPNVASDGAPGNETVTFNYNFSIATAAFLTFSVWADDTAQVILDGVSLMLPNAVQDGACAAGAIGCQPGEQGTFANLALLAGEHNIDLLVHQRVLLEVDQTGTPFGVMMAGDLTPVPEPATILLLGSALTAAGMASRRRWQKKKSLDS